MNYGLFNLLANLQNYNGFKKNQRWLKLLFKEGKTKCVLFSSFWILDCLYLKKNLMLTAELFSELKYRLDALRRSL